MGNLRRASRLRRQLGRLLFLVIAFVAVLVWVFRLPARASRSRTPANQIFPATKTPRRRTTTMAGRARGRRGHPDRDDRPRVGRHQGARHSDAAVVAVDALRHDRLGRDLHHIVPGLAAGDAGDAGAARLLRAAARSPPQSTRSARRTPISRPGSPPPTSARSRKTPSSWSSPPRGARRCSATTARRVTAPEPPGWSGATRTFSTTTGSGGNAADIQATVTHGIRYDADADTRFSQMPAFGDILEPAQIEELTQHVLSISGQPHDAAGSRPVRRSSPRTAPPATARTAPACASSAPRTSPTASGSTAARR